MAMRIFFPLYPNCSVQHNRRNSLLYRMEDFWGIRTLIVPWCIHNWMDMSIHFPLRIAHFEH